MKRRKFPDFRDCFGFSYHVKSATSDPPCRETFLFCGRTLIILKILILKSFVEKIQSDHTTNHQK